MFYRTLLCAIVTCVCMSFDLATAVAQSPPEPSADDKKLEALLDETGVLYRKRYLEEQQRWEYNAAMDSGSETSVIKIYLKPWRTRRDGSTIYTIYCWSVVAEIPKDQPVPPEVVKFIAAVNDALGTGNCSIIGNNVFANVGVVMQDLSASAFGLYLADLHDNRVQLKKEVEKLLNAQQ